jgi:hypothetical protein
LLVDQMLSAHLKLIRKSMVALNCICRIICPNQF